LDNNVAQPLGILKDLLHFLSTPEQKYNYCLQIVKVSLCFQWQGACWEFSMVLHEIRRRDYGIKSLFGVRTSDFAAISSANEHKFEENLYSLWHFGCWPDHV
jgi:hypothetical protein